MVGEAKKISVFRGLYLGDLVAATPALRALRRGYPQAEISLSSLPWAAALAPHLAGCVDRVIPYPGAPGLDGEGSEADLDRFVGRMRAERFDLAVNLHGRGPQSARLVSSFGALRTAGFVGGEGEYPPLTVSVPWEAEEHETRKLLLLATRAGGNPDGEEPLLRVREEDRRRAGELLGRVGEAPLAVLHPGASTPEKRWPAAGFGRVARGLLARGYAVLVTGSGGEAGLAEEVCGHAPGSVNLAGRTDLSALISLVERADLLVSNDTGPAHLAYALRTPSVTIFGPSTDTARWGPSSGERHAVLVGDPISRVRAEGVLEVAGLLAGERAEAPVR